MPGQIRICLAVLLAAAALAGCGSSGGSTNGLSSQSPDQVVAAAQAATNGATSVHVSGATTSSGQPVALDLSLSSGQGGRGTFSQGGLSVDLVAIGSTIYLKGTPAFWTKFGGAAVAQLLAGRWLKAPATNPNFAGIAQLTDFHKLLTTTLTQHGALAKGGVATVNGQPAVAVKDTSNGGILYVAATGKPYPLAIAKSGSGGDRLVLDRWNQPVSVSAPAGAIDVTQLKGVK